MCKITPKEGNAMQVVTCVAERRRKSELEVGAF